MRTLWWGLGGMSALAALSVYSIYRVVTRYVDFGDASSDLPAAVEAYRRDGLPWLARDVAPPRLRDGENAAVALRDAFARMPKRSGADAWDLLRHGRLTEADAALAGAAPVLAIVEKARPLPRMNFNRDWDMGPQLLFPEYAKMKSLTRFASARAVREAARGQDDAALRDLDLARQISLWSGQEPTLISMLVRTACEAIAVEAAARCLAAVAKEPLRIARYRDWLVASPPLPNFGDALRGEAFFGVTTERNLDRFGGADSITRLSQGDGPTPTVSPRDLRRDGLPENTQVRAFMARHLQIWDEAYRTTDGFRKPPREVGARLDALSDKIDKEKGLSWQLESIIFPVFGQAGQAIVSTQARRAVGLGLAEALDVHARTGRWPTSVKGVDPFTSGPLHVKQTANDFRVYSVGRDGKDNGGLHRNERPAGSSAPFDEVAAYPPIPSRGPK